MSASEVKRARRHSPLIARVWVCADKCAYAGVGDGILNVVKATVKGAVLRESYFSIEALYFHHCGLSAEAAVRHFSKITPPKTEPQSLTPVSGFLIGK